MPIDRMSFFVGYFDAFGRPEQRQVDALDELLDAIDLDEDLTDPRHIAYLLATVKHECADTWLPITERGPRAYFDKYEPTTLLGQRLGNTTTGDGWRFRGRGYVQITGRANYERMGSILGCGDIEADPDKALSPSLAYLVLSVGMREGLFTGKDLLDYIDAEHCDYLNARRVINGLDQSETIAGYAHAFETILRGAQADGTV